MKIAEKDKLTIDDLAAEATAATKALEKRAILGNLIDKLVMNEPRGPKRWRAAVNLWIALENYYTTPGFTAEEENRIVINQNRMKRKGLKNKYGLMSDAKSVTNGGGNSDIREALCMPAGADMFLRLVDPEITSKENTFKLMKEFKEYCVPEAI